MAWTNYQVNNVLLGNGNFLIGSPLQDVGPIKGNATVDITRKVDAFKAGVPQTTLKQLTTDEEVFFKATLATFDLARIQQVLGVGQFTSVPSGTQAISNYQVTFNDAGPVGQTPSGMLLGATNIASTPAPVVTSVPSGTTYVAGTDYLIDFVNGMITRITPGSTIPPSATVAVSFSYTAVPAQVYAFGGSCNVLYYPGKFIHTGCNANRVIFDMWRCSTNGKWTMEWKETDWNTYDVQFNLLADVGKPIGQYYFQITNEYTGTPP